MKFPRLLLVVLGVCDATGARRLLLSEEEEARIERRQTSDTARFAEHNSDQLVCVKSTLPSRMSIVSS